MSKDKDYIANIEGAERRFYTPEIRVEKRMEGDDEGPKVIEGYGALFNSRTNISGMWEEEILPGAFDDVMDDDVRALFNHNPNYVCARHKSGTLNLAVDTKGYSYSFPVSKRSYVQDLADAIESGDVSESSFAFTIKEEKWIEREGDIPLRQIVKFKKIYDVSPVTYPAYPDTSVGARSLADAKKEFKKEEEIPVKDKRFTTREAELVMLKLN